MKDNFAPIIVSASITAVFTLAFGWTGFKTALIISALFLFPFYLILKGFEEIERLVLAVFLSLAIFPLLTFYLFKLIPSMKYCYLITVIFVYIFGVIRCLKKSTSQ